MILRVSAGEADGDGAGLVAQAGMVLLVQAAERAGLTRGLSAALAP